MKTLLCLTVAVAAVGTLAGCAIPAVIADIEHDKVIVESNQHTDRAEIRVEAARGCALHGRKARFISRRIVPTSALTALEHHLFACHDPDGASPDPE